MFLQQYSTTQAYLYLKQDPNRIDPTALPLSLVQALLIFINKQTDEDEWSFHIWPVALQSTSIGDGNEREARESEKFHSCSKSRQQPCGESPPRRAHPSDAPSTKTVASYPE